MVFEAVCKTLLWWPSGANVVRFIDATIRKRLISSFLRIVLGDPYGNTTTQQRSNDENTSIWSW